MAYIKKIDHIGIVVADMKEAIKAYKKLLFKEPSCLERHEEAKVDLAFFDVGEIQVELLAPCAPDSEVSSFLEEKGGGIHHVCFEVEGIEEILEELKKKGMKLIDEHPRPGSRDSHVAFVDPASAKGVYIEYCEFPKSKG